MAVRLTLPLFDGLKGPVQCSQFLNSIESVFQAQNVPEQRKHHMCMTAFQQGSPAATWLDNIRIEEPDACADWTHFRQAIEDEFCRPWTLAQHQLFKKTLVLKPEETANGFYNRVRFYHNTKDFQILPAVRATDAYKSQFSARVKETFLEGLPADLLARLAAVDTATITIADLVARVVQAQALVPAASHQVSEISQEVAPIYNNRSSGGFRGRGRGRGRGGYQRSQSSNFANKPRPSPQELASRQLQQCGRCKRMAKHRTNECRVDLRTFNPNNNGYFNRNASNNSRGPRVNEVQNNNGSSSSTAPSDADFADPLNGILG